MNLIKKTVSVVFVTVFLIGMFPAIGLAQTGESIGYSFVFSAPAFNEYFIDLFYNEELTRIDMNDTARAAMVYDAIDRTASAPWSLFEYVPNNLQGKGTIYQERMLLHGDYNEGAYISFKIVVPKSGWYKASTVYDKGKYSGDIDVYFAKYSDDVTDVMITENLIGSFDSYSYGAQSAIAEEFGRLYVEEQGEYLLVYEINANENTEFDDSNRIFMYLRSFNLTFLQYSNANANYVFKAESLGSDSLISGLSEGYTDYSNIVPELTDNWAYAGRDMPIDLNVGSNHMIIQDRNTPFFWAALKIEVPQKGSYDVYITTRKNAISAVDFDVYIIPYTENIEEAVNSLDLNSMIGSVQGENDALLYIEDKVGIFTADTIGDYILILKSTAANAGYTSGNHYLYLQSLFLDGVTNYIEPPDAPEDNEDISINQYNIMILTANSSNSDTAVPAIITTNLDGYTQGSSKAYAIGTQVTATAPANTGTGQSFKYWMHKGSHRIVTTNTQVTFSLGTNTTLVAVYSDTSEGVLVEFIDRNGKLITSGYYDEGDAIVYPDELPISVGYGQATGWSLNPDTVGTSDLAIIATYDEPGEVYNITVINGTGSGSYKYNDKVIVTAPTTDGAKVFSHWTRDGKVISYSTEYSFYVWDSATLTAHYAYEKPIIIPGIVLDGVVKMVGTNRYFMGELIGFDDEEIIESGMLYGSSAVLDIANYDAKVCALSKTTQFTTWTGEELYQTRAYVVYRDKEDKIRIAYSEVR